MSLTLSVLLPTLVRSLLPVALAQAPAAQATHATTTGAFECETPDQVDAGQPLQLTCTARPELRAVAVVLFHRASGREAFTPAPGLRTARSMFKVSLCPDAFPAGTVHFYVEARDAEDKVVASSGDLENPHLASVHGRTSRLIAERPLGTRASAIRDDDPLAEAREERDAQRLAVARSVQRSPGRLFVGFGAGLGYGAYPESQLDFRRDLRIQGNLGPAGVVLLTPEVGYQLSHRLAIGVQLYWQQLSGEGIGDAQAGSPARRSFTVLARGSYHAGDGRLQWLASAFLGAGDGFHLVVPPLPDQGLRRNDSVRAGPVVVGPGTGLLLHLHPHAALIAETRLLSGLPRWGAVIDTRVGAEVSF
jgi:hypothetical protein